MALPPPAPPPRDLLAVPPHRMAAIRGLLPALTAGHRVALSTHINADGDGCGSEAGLARILAAVGVDARIVNPTPWPGVFDFLLGSDLADETTRGAAALAGIDVLVVLDIGDVRRLGALADAVRALTIPKLVIDHHLPGDEPPGPTVFSDTTACATGELVFDLAVVAGWPISRDAATALYTALLTDTGGFRFSNTSPRCHAIAGYLLSLGIDPEEMYRRVYASVPLGRLHLLRDALATLDVDPEYGIAWISVPAGYESRARGRALRAQVRGPGWHRRASAIDRRDAAGDFLPGPRARQSQSVVPQHGRRGRQPARAAVRRGRPRESGRRARRGLTRGREDGGNRRGASVHRPTVPATAGPRRLTFAYGHVQAGGD